MNLNGTQTNGGGAQMIGQGGLCKGAQNHTTYGSYN